jgi:regulatory protein
LDARRARSLALDALSRRDHASAELGRKLQSRGFDADVVAEVLERLRAEGLVDDHRYVENFVGFRAARGQGPNRVRADLRKIGLQGEIVEEAVNTYPDWIVHLQRARQKKFGPRSTGGNAAKLREIRFLTYRGFTSTQIRSALGFDTDLDSENDPL